MSQTPRSPAGESERSPPTRRRSADGDVKKEQLKLSSANRIYEEKLTEAAQIRGTLRCVAQHELAWSHLTGTRLPMPSEMSRST